MCTTVSICDFLLKCCFHDSYEAVNSVIIMPVGLLKAKVILTSKANRSIKESNKCIAIIYI